MVDAEGMIFSVEPKHPRDLHHLTLTLEAGWVRANIECKHEDFPEGYACGGLISDSFWEEFGGESGTPARDGLIEFYWDGHGEEAELWWKYVEEPA